MNRRDPSISSGDLRKDAAQSLFGFGEEAPGGELYRDQPGPVRAVRNKKGKPTRFAFFVCLTDCFFMDFSRVDKIAEIFFQQGDLRQQPLGDMGDKKDAKADNQRPQRFRPWGYVEEITGYRHKKAQAGYQVKQQGGKTGDENACPEKQGERQQKRQCQQLKEPFEDERLVPLLSLLGRRRSVMCRPIGPIPGRTLFFSNPLWR